MDWKRSIEQAFEKFASPTGVRFFAPCQNPLVEYPEELAELLHQTDGVNFIDEHYGWEDRLVWPHMNQVEATQRLAGELPEGSLVLCDAGVDGILFVALRGGGVAAYYPIEESLREVSTSLWDYIVGWPSGRITV